MTNAYIKKNPNIPTLSLEVPLSGIEEQLQSFPYLLIIQSTASTCTRLTIYPLKKNRIVKLSILGSDVPETGIEGLSNIIKSYKSNIIHTSGLLVLSKSLNFECYFNMSLKERKTKDLKTSLNNLRNIFKEIKIEEIALNGKK